MLFSLTSSPWLICSMLSFVLVTMATKLTLSILVNQCITHRGTYINKFSYVLKHCKADRLQRAGNTCNRFLTPHRTKENIKII